MIKVKQRENEPVIVMIKRFKKLCEKEGLTKDIKRCAVFEKPSEKKRRLKRRPFLGTTIKKTGPGAAAGPGEWSPGGPSGGPRSWGR